MDWRRLFDRSRPTEPAASAERKASSPAASSAAAPPRELAVAFGYHERTKHHPMRFANGPGYMDWDTQPDPFRRWLGADLLPLAHVAPTDEPRYEEVFVAGRLAPQPLTRRTLSQLLFDSLALSAWKRAGEAHWSLRVNPSSGNLHPTEGYVIAPPIAGLDDAPFVAHYAPKEHALERRARLDPTEYGALARALAVDGREPLLFVALTSIHWREAWKYGERAYRYCNHDVGHAIACVRLAAAALGWSATVLDGFGSDELAELLHLSDTRHPEAEEPDCLLVVTRSAGAVSARASAPLPAPATPRGTWFGSPSTLSPDHADWPVIDDVAASCRQVRGQALARDFAAPWPPLVVGDEAIPFRRIVHQRRSAVAMDGRSGLAADAFFQTLRRTLPASHEAPYDALPWSPRIHLALFVHRVQGVEPGIYLLVRNPADEPLLRRELRAEFTWAPVPGASAHLPLVHLHSGDVRGLAARLSCDQAIAGEGCFSLGMLANFTPSLERDGPAAYPRLFWESGLVGQALYLEAEALTLRATGIGCFYDDQVHAALGLRTRTFQSLYHFTIGGPVDDPRITQEPAYAELRD
jgi:SagB-type dehydrogenase family enzyme